MTFSLLAEDLVVLRLPEQLPILARKSLSQTLLRQRPLEQSGVLVEPASTLDVFQRK